MVIYQPSEDSYLFSETLKKEIEDTNIKILEMGVGSGFQLETLFSLGASKENLLGVDINPKAVEHSKKLGFKAKESDLFENIPSNEIYNIIIFNPPYLPLDEDEPEDSRRETTAGEKGNEIMIKFLKQAKDYLTETGIIFIMTSSLSKSVNFDSLDYDAKIIYSKKLFFEELFVWKLKNKLNQ